MGYREAREEGLPCWIADDGWPGNSLSPPWTALAVSERAWKGTGWARMRQARRCQIGTAMAQSRERGWVGMVVMGMMEVVREEDGATWRRRWMVERAKGRLMGRSGVCCVLSLFCDFPLCRSRQVRSSDWCRCARAILTRGWGGPSPYYAYRILTPAASLGSPPAHLPPAASTEYSCLPVAHLRPAPVSRRGRVSHSPRVDPIRDSLH